MTNSRSPATPSRPMTAVWCHDGLVDVWSIRPTDTVFREVDHHVERVIALPPPMTNRSLRPGAPPVQSSSFAGVYFDDDLVLGPTCALCGKVILPPFSSDYVSPPAAWRIEGNIYLDTQSAARYGMPRDYVGRFADEVFRYDEGGHVPNVTVYQAAKLWYDDEGLGRELPSKVELSRRLTQHGYETSARSGQRCKLNVVIADKWQERLRAVANDVE